MKKQQKFCASSLTLARRTQKLDPTNRKSPVGRIVRKTVPVSCAVAGVIASSPGVITTTGAAVTAHGSCYKFVDVIQRPWTYPSSVRFRIKQVVNELNYPE